MTAFVHNILVVGGNGFVGSAVCKAALARGMQVTSISSSGRSYKTPKGHSPAWTSKVNWLKADALDPSSYARLLPDKTAIVHTLGTLFEDTRYKAALKSGNLGAVAGSFLGSMLGGTGNPLAAGSNSKGSYETINRDSALRVCETFVSGDHQSAEVTGPRPFVYLSAEDIFRPFIPSGYIETKRHAELGISAITRSQPGYRGVYIRPSLIYHPYIRPLTTPIATLLDLSATLHRKLPPNLPTPSNVLRSIGSALSDNTSTPSEGLSPSSFSSVANALVIPPIHVDHVAEAICLAIQNDDVAGVVGVKEMRDLIGWSYKGASPQTSS
ncbi:mitochondrial protein [Rickenella mellea]|uniref:Mitochondrial protein n=1 Tax=Rickenella mellea TaxID=50990 RepID=A0A4Y7QCE5_9AGAM|nr:mitochondrial protein [Rickenella mellea]